MMRRHPASSITCRRGTFLRAKPSELGQSRISSCLSVSFNALLPKGRSYSVEENCLDWSERISVQFDLEIYEFISMIVVL